jgi:hypothetical protein
MKAYMTKILGPYVLDVKTLALLSEEWALNISSRYGNPIRRYFAFCDEHWLAPLAATPAHIGRYVAWLGQLGSIKASCVEPYLSAVNGFVNDHGLEAVALGDLVAKVRKGFAASQVAIDDTTYVYTFQYPSSSKPYAWPKPYNSSSLNQQRVQHSTPSKHANKHDSCGHVR